MHLPSDVTGYTSPYMQPVNVEALHHMASAMDENFWTHATQRQKT